MPFLLGGALDLPYELNSARNLKFSAMLDFTRRLKFSALLKFYAAQQHGIKF
ncbi:hypothetical protein [uncultured Campylobacter sp.]|uniref:hypothetical protein n=1 Tax=uncultured Campylobacter sp. TaxID=218934 RepID=UPI002626261D|nr:hypothetical protein [uncultured Campylobacter sp.]